ADRRQACGKYLAMSDDHSSELYQARIVALAKSKTGAGKLPSPTRSARRDNGKIAEIAHQVRGCLLCQASAAALASTAVGRDAAGVAELRHDAERAIGREAGKAHEPFDAFEPVAADKSRQECVLLPFEALKDALS